MLNDADTSPRNRERIRLLIKNKLLQRLTMHYSKMKITQDGAVQILEHELVYMNKQILQYGLVEPVLS